MKASIRERIRVFVHACGFPGATLREIAEAFDKPMHTLSGRISELKALGHIYDSGREREGCAVLVSQRAWVNGGAA